MKSGHRSEVLHVAPALFDPSVGTVGGAERYALELARHMAERVPTRLVAFGRRGLERTVGRLSVRVIGEPHYIRGQNANPIAAALIPEISRARIVHCHQQHILTSSLSAIVARLLRRGIFVTDHGGGGWDVSTYFSTDRWYHAHLHVSEFSRRIYGQGESPGARVLSGGVDPDRFSPPGAPNARRDVVYVGRILPHKGIHDLILGLPPGLRLRILGPPIDHRYLAELHKLASDKDVLFRHESTDSEIICAYQTSLCVVLPSAYRDYYGEVTRVPELLGQTLLEAMSCGTPVLCTNVGAMPEVVEDGVSGFVVPPNDPNALGTKLDWYNSNRERADEMGRAARKRILERFSWQRVVERCLETYGEYGFRVGD